MLVLRHPRLIKIANRRMIINIKDINNSTIIIIINNSSNSIGSSSSSNKMMARPQHPRTRAQVRGIATMETWNNPARAPDVRRAVACRLSFSPPTVTYIFARKPPVAVLLHHQSYQQHQAISTASIATSSLGEGTAVPLPPPPLSLAPAAVAVTPSLISSSSTTAAATGVTYGGGMLSQPSLIQSPLQQHQHVQPQHHVLPQQQHIHSQHQHVQPQHQHQHVQSQHQHIQHQQHVQHQPHVQTHQMQHQVPVQNVHVQNIQAQNIQVQNLLVQPSSSGTGLEQNIQAQNVQLQTVQGATGGYLAQGVVAPFCGMQIQNIGAPPPVPQVPPPPPMSTYGVATENPATEAKPKYDLAADVKVKVESEDKKTDVTIDSKYINNSSNNGDMTATIPTKNENQTLFHSSAVASSAPTTFQLVTATSVTTLPTSSAQNYIMAYSHVPTSETNVQIIGSTVEGGKTTVLSLSQPMLVNLEPPQTTSAAAQWTMHPVIFSANNVCCLTPQTNSGSTNASGGIAHKDPTEVKLARTPVGPTAQLTHHSPQLPVPSPNYPIQSQLAPDTNASDQAKSESRNIPNRNVPILNNNYMHSGNVHHSEFTSHSTSARAPQFSEISNNSAATTATLVLGHNQLPPQQQQQQQQQQSVVTTDCRRTISDNSCTTGFIRNGNGGVVYSEHLSSNNNELFNNNQVVNVNEVNCSDNNNKVNVKSEATCTQAHTKLGHDRATPTLLNQHLQQQSKDYESLIIVNQIVNTNLLTNTATSIVVPTPPHLQQQQQQHTSVVVETPTPTSAPFTVLNVPSVGRFKASELPESRPLVSKLDVATAKRRERRMKRRLHRKPTTSLQQHGEDSDSSIYSSSDTDSEDGINARVVDLWITSGPPDKPDYKPEKLKFLKIFGLTTHVDKNEVELAKLERRKWQAPWKAMLPDEGQQPPCLDLPVPSSHPTLLNHTPDFGAKVHFFCELGLRTMSDRSREELETTWQKIIENRQKRDGETALTTYCVRAYRKMRKHAGAVVQVPRISDMRHNGQQKPHSILLPPVQTPHTFPRLPFSHQSSTNAENHHSQQFSIEPDAHESRVSCPPPPLPTAYHNNNGLKRSMDAQAYAATVKRMSLEQHPNSRNEAKDVKNIVNAITATKNASTITDKEKLKWPGIQEVMESYHKYNKERTIEMTHLRSRCSYLSDQIRRRQTEADVLERKLRELRSLHIFHDQERQQIQRSVDQLKSVLYIFR